MKKNSFEYRAIQWSNNQNLSNNIIISELRSNAFFSNEVIPLENTLNLQQTKNYVKYLNEKKPKFIISYKENFDGHFLKDCIGDVYKISDYFEKGSRNPFNRGKVNKIYIYYFNYYKLDYCANLNR